MTHMTNAVVYTGHKLIKTDISFCDGRFVSVSPVAPTVGEVFDFSDRFLFPGFTDVHVHFREPGFSYKETIRTGSMAAAAGGYTSVCTMPNLSPAPDDLQNILAQKSIIDKTAVVNVYPYGTITKGQNGGELSDMEAMAPVAVAFSDDGKGVQSDSMMRQAMEKAKSLGKIIAAHSEDNSLLRGGYIHDGEYCRTHGHRGICSESEWGQIKRDLALAKETDCAYHVCHISCRESVELIRKAKKEGVNVTCETGPHYLVLDDSMLQEHGRWKMNPPLRSADDRKALIEGIQDGTIDMIATDHAPHSAEEKSRGLEKSLMGVVGLETAFPVCYTELVKTKMISLERLMELLHDNAKKRFGIGSDIEEGAPASFTVFDLDKSYSVDSSKFLTMGRATPFEGRDVSGECLLTVCGGKVAYKK